MKKIAIITRHAVPNYGSLYQAYALQEAIKKINNEPFIVDAEYSYCLLYTSPSPRDCS